VATQVVRQSKLDFEVGDLSSVVQVALSTAADKSKQSVAAFLGDMQKGNCRACESARYWIAKAVGEYLGALDAGTKSVYYFEPDYATSFDDVAVNGPGASPGINLLVWAGRKTAALEALVSAVSDELRKETAAFACAKSNPLCWALDAQIVDDEQVQQRRGYGAIIQSVHVRPIELWSR